VVLREASKFFDILWTQKHTKIVCYLNNNWIDSSFDRRLTSRYHVSNLISWKINKLNALTKSSVEAS